MTTELLKVDLSALDAVIDGAEAQLLANTRPAAQAGAQVLYAAVVINVAALGRKTGNLASSIYQAFSEQNSELTTAGYAKATYHVSWNSKKAPHGHLLENGFIQKYKVYVGRDGNWYTNKNAPLATPVQRPAHAFVRRAMSEFPRAEQAMVDRLLQGV